MTVDTDPRSMRIRRTILLALAVAAGAALSMLVWFVCVVALFPFVWSAGIIYGLWITFGMNVILVLVAAARLLWRKDKPCYWHAVLLGMFALTLFMVLSSIVEYGFHTAPR